jgi:hypothetical protein
MNQPDLTNILLPDKDGKLRPVMTGECVDWSKAVIQFGPSSVREEFEKKAQEWVSTYIHQYGRGTPNRNWMSYAILVGYATERYNKLGHKHTGRISRCEFEKRFVNALRIYRYPMLIYEETLANVADKIIHDVYHA